MNGDVNLLGFIELFPFIMSLQIVITFERNLGRIMGHVTDFEINTF